MDDLERMLTEAQESGRITVDDADTVREFREFLRDAGPARNMVDGKWAPMPPADHLRYVEALLRHAEFCGMTDDERAECERVRDKLRARIAATPTEAGSS